MMNSGIAPWIGMPAQMDPNDDKQYLSRHYSDAIVATGGLPVMIPLLPTAEAVGPLADKLDGILLTGNDSDLDPALYRASRLDVCGPTQPLRDRMDFFLLEKAMKRGIPVLAICFGVQSLNVFLGGTLIQDIATEIDTPIRHSSPETKGSPNSQDPDKARLRSRKTGRRTRCDGEQHSSPVGCAARNGIGGNCPCSRWRD